MPITLRDGENLIKIARRHTFFLLPSFFAWPLIIVGLFIARYSLSFDFFGYWMWSLVVGVLVVLLIIFYKYFVWKNNALIITDKRLIENEQSGFFSKTVTELLYRDIGEINYSKHGMSAALYDYGDLKITTRAESEIILPDIANPDETVELINKIRQNNPN